MRAAIVLSLLVAMALAVEDQAARRRLLDRQRLQRLRQENRDNPGFRGGKVISTWDGTEIREREWDSEEAEEEEEEQARREREEGDSGDTEEEEPGWRPWRRVEGGPHRRLHHGGQRGPHHGRGGFHHGPGPHMRHQGPHMRNHGPHMRNHGPHMRNHGPHMRNHGPHHRFGADIDFDMDGSWKDLIDSDNFDVDFDWEDLSEGQVGLPGMSFKWDLGDLGVSFFKSFGVWWKGPNVCERVEEFEEEVQHEGAAGKKSIFRHSIFTASTCDETETAYKCTTVYGFNGMKKTRTQIYECCHGYRRNEGQRGCPIAVELKNIIETAEELNATEAVDILNGLKLDDLLLEGNYTIFIPTDKAMSKFKPQEPSVDDNVVVVKPDMQWVEEKMEGLKDVISAHIVEGFRRTSTLGDEEMLHTEHTQAQIRINRYTVPKKMVTANCVPLTSADNVATNGVIHLVDRVLTPVESSILDVVNADQRLTILKELLDQADMQSQLKKSGQFTLFAPTDEAFRKLNPALGHKLLEGHQCLDSILQNHLLGNVICSSVIEGRVRSMNALDRYLNLTRTDSGHLMVNGAEVVVKDVMATNGVVHIIDTVLVPEEALTILEVADGAQANMMLELLMESELLDELSNMDNFTLFIPTDDAFKRLPGGTLSRLRDDKEALRQVLMYHMVSGQKEGEDLLNGLQLQTLGSDKQVAIKKYHSYPFSMKQTHTAQCAPIVTMDLKACGGIAHIVDRVMMPPGGHIMKVLKDQPRFSHLVEMLETNDELSGLLSKDGPFTLFAPTNDAWELAKEDLEEVLIDRDSVATLLQRHIIKGSLCCAGVMNSHHGLWRSRETTLDRTHRLSINRGRDNQVIVGSKGVPVTQCDLTASNGVIHVVDQVIPDSLTRDRHRPSKGHKWMRDIHSFMERHMGKKFDWDWDDPFWA